jgi:predicted AAA+ superfamily ATPase
MYLRWQQGFIHQALQTRRVLAITGPRQCGKTTLAKTLLNDTALYRTLDNPEMLKVAQLDPVEFVTHDQAYMIIDEVQRVPELLLAIKLRVDENTRYGQYILTGSANLYQLPRTQDSLAGRIRHLRLRPLTQGEIAGTAPHFLQRAFQREWPKSIDTHWGRKKTIAQSFIGGYPEVLALSEKERKSWYRSYLQAVLGQDMQELLDIRRPAVMEKLVQTVAAWSGKYMNTNAIGSHLEIQRRTLDNYLSALESFFLLERIPPWTYTDYEYVGKHDKLFMTDTGLMAAQLGWTPQQVEMDSDRSGKLIETFVFTQLAALIEASEEEYTLYHYRDRLQREIDFMIQGPAGSLLGLEVKSGSAPDLSDAKHLIWFAENQVKGTSFTGIVLHTGNQTYRLKGENIWAVPIASLWGK